MTASTSPAEDSDTWPLPGRPESGPPVGIVMPLAYARGGCEVQLATLLVANRDGPRVAYHVCFLEPGPMVEQIRALGYPATVIPAGRLRQPTRYLSTVLQLRRWIRQNRLRYVVSWMEKAHLYTSPAAVLAGVPSAWWLRSIDPSSRVLKLIDRLPADQVFACSNAAVRSLRGGRENPDVTVRRSAVDLARFDPDAMPTMTGSRDRLGLPVGRPIVGMVARLQRWKGIEVFIDAAAKCRTDPAPLFIVVGGEHPLEPGVLAAAGAQVGRLGLGDRVRFAGYQADVPVWMQACDVVVHASITPEPLGMVIVEAMALGKCVVASRAGGPLEIVTDGVDGRLVDPGDSAALAAAIAAALSDTQANVTMRALARRRACDFGARSMAELLAADLARQMAKSSATPQDVLKTPA